MKKILLFFIFIIIVIGLSPIVGNSVIQSALKERVIILTSNGLEVKNQSTNSTYFKTKKHYEFLVSDTSKFVEYLSQYSSGQIPPYVYALIDGAVVGVDINYGNFPFGSKIKIDIYPLSFSTKTMQDLKEDKNFYRFIQNLLNSKGILYHINYDVTSENFDGFIKDIDEKYTFDNGVEVELKILKATYSGNGVLIAPQNLETNIKNIVFKIVNSDENFILKMKNTATYSTFDSHSTYLSSAIIKDFIFIISDAQTGKTKVNIENLKFNISSNTQGKEAEFYTKSSFSKMNVDSNISSFKILDFNYDISVDGVNKDAYEKFRKLSDYAGAVPTQKTQDQLTHSVIKVLSKGLNLNIADFSMGKVSFKNKKLVNGFSIMSRLSIDEDLDLANKLKSNPATIINNISLNSQIKISKDLYIVLNSEIPLIKMVKSYAKEDENNFVFNIKLDAGKLSINSKVVR